MAVTQTEPEESDLAASVEALASSLDEADALMQNLLEGTHDEHLHTLNRMCVLTGAVVEELQAIAQRLGERRRVRRRSWGECSRPCWERLCQSEG